MLVIYIYIYLSVFLVSRILSGAWAGSFINTHTHTHTHFDRWSSRGYLGHNGEINTIQARRMWDEKFRECQWVSHFGASLLCQYAELWYFFHVISGALNDLGQIIYRLYIYIYYRHYIDGAGDITLVYMKNKKRLSPRLLKLGERIWSWKLRCCELPISRVIPGTPNNGTPLWEASHIIPISLGILMGVVWE